MAKNIALLGDPSNHGGTLVSTAQDGTVKVGGVMVCVNGCSHSCPLPNHGTTPVTAVTIKSRINGKLIVTQGATAGCGAVITPPSRGVTVE